ncbi:MAG: redoxin domain-containing protein [Ferruginibacter sp.]
MALSAGEKAPNFSLFNSEKTKITLSDSEGSKNVLLLFFPQAFTGVCTKELCSVRDGINKYHNDSTEILGISVDSVFTLDKFKAEQQYNFSLLSDFNKDVSNLYEAIHESFTDMGMKGVSKRSAFIIDKAGVLQYAEVLDNPGLMPNFEAIDKKLAELA